jgi:pectin methylesterase-like acyl-CoA thioesterase
MYNYNTVSGEADIATGHAMQVFNHCIIQIVAGLLVWHNQLPW